MYSKEKKMEMLEAYDLTKSFRAAAELAGCDHKTVATAVAARGAGIDLANGERASVVDAFDDKITEMVNQSRGLVRADVVHERLCAMGYDGSERTTRRAVAEAKKRWNTDNHRIYKPWITEPGKWMQWDYGWGPVVGGVQVILFCAWLAWSRYRFVTPLRDKTMPSVIAALDGCFRFFGGAPTYCLTDNEKTVTDRHVAGIAVRNPQIVSFATYYGTSIVTCLPADPESKGGSESTVRIAKADIVPTDHNLIGEYRSWDDVVSACASFCATVNNRVHREIAQAPAERFAVEQQQLHSIPHSPYTATFGETRTVSWSALISFKGARYSVPHRLGGGVVWVRIEGDCVVMVATPDSGPIEVARHKIVPAGNVSINNAHYPTRRNSGPDRRPVATNASEVAFLSLGAGAERWLCEAAAMGTRKVETKMAEAVELAVIYGNDRVDRALGEAAIAGRFAQGDLISILETHGRQSAERSESFSMQAGTSSWANVGVGGEK